jgi:hypothetical protein
VHLACKAVLESLTELSLAEEDAPDYEGGSVFSDKDVIAALRSLIVTVCTEPSLWMIYYD